MIQVLRNAVVVGVSDYEGTTTTISTGYPRISVEQRYKGVGPTLLKLRGVGVHPISRNKALRNTYRNVLG